MFPSSPVFQGSNETLISGDVVILCDAFPIVDSPNFPMAQVSPPAPMDNSQKTR